MEECGILSCNMEDEMARQISIDGVSSDRRLGTESGRREFLRSLGLGAAGAAVLGTTATFSSEANAQAVTDAAILTFALNLEYLEAEFYLRAATGVGLPPQDIGPNPGPVIGGAMVNFMGNATVKAYATEIAQEEHKHVQFLRAALTALTGSAISRPALDLSSSFAAAALIAGLGTGFSPYADPNSFLLGAYIFEDVGVTAYHGAAPLIANKVILDKAAGILAAEAYHAGIIRASLFVGGFASQTTAISNLRASLDGTIHTQNQDDFGVGTTAAPMIANLSNAMNGSLLGGFPSNSPPGNNAIAFDRTTRQVLNIVYGGVNASSGLFFPAGLNGPIR
jgi:Ferritin-like domain